MNEQTEQKQVQVQWLQLLCLRMLGIIGICQEPELPGVVEVVEVDDRLPVLDLPDGDACGLQIFELLGRGGCVQHVDVRLPRFHLRLGI